MHLLFGFTLKFKACGENVKKMLKNAAAAVSVATPKVAKLCLKGNSHLPNLTLTKTFWVICIFHS